MSFSLILFYIITLLFSAFSIFISKRKFGIWINHYVLYNVYWCVALTLSIFFNNFDKPVSDDIYFIFFAGTFFFNVTLFFAKITPFNKAYKPDNVFMSLNKRRVVEMLVLAMVVPLAYTNLKAILSGTDLWMINHEYWDGRKEGSYIEQFFTQNVIAPLSTLIMTTCFYAKYKSKGKISMLLCIIIGASMALLNMLLTGGGRTGLMQFIYIVFLSYCAGGLLSGNTVVRIRTKYVVVFVLLAVIGIGWASMGRGEEKMIADVLVDRITLFSALFEGYYVGTNHCEGYYFGLAMFETPIAILASPLKFLGLELDFDRMSVIEQVPLFAPADGKMHNAAVSAYLYYMKDFGKLGIMIGPIITATVYNLLYRVFRKSDFLMFFYFTAICLTCLETAYPFGRGFIFLFLFALLYNKYAKS